MQVRVSNRTLLRSLMSGAIVLLGASACSRSDRVESGSDNTAAITQDTAISGAAQDAPGTGQDRVASDTTARAATASPSADRPDTSASAESGTAGYRATERESETSVNRADTSVVETAGAVISDTDTTMDTAGASGYAEMARDTTGGADQIDTTARATGNVAAISDTVAGDAAMAARGADTTGNAGRIRPPEDSTEMEGNVSSAESAGVNAADTADEAPVAAEVPESNTGDHETQVASEDRTDTVGAAAIDGTVTGDDAVAMITRQGEQCTVVDPESDEEVRWDMSSTPATLNPCGLGSMNLSKVWTEQR